MNQKTKLNVVFLITHIFPGQATSGQVKEKSSAANLEAVPAEKLFQYSIVILQLYE